MRTKLTTALSVLMTLSLINLGAAGCGCKEAESSIVVRNSADSKSVGNGAEARPKPDKDNKKPCKKGGKKDTRGTKPKTKGINRGTFKTRAEAVAARARDMKGRNPVFARTREECSPKKCHLHLDLNTTKRSPGNDAGPVETLHYTYHRR